MSKLKMVLAAATVCGALGMGNASAMPMDNLALDNQSNIESVRYVCDVYGHCFWRPNYYAPASSLLRAASAGAANDDADSIRTAPSTNATRRTRDNSFNMQGSQ